MIGILLNQHPGLWQAIRYQQTAHASADRNQKSTVLFSRHVQAVVVPTSCSRQPFQWIGGLHSLTTWSIQTAAEKSLAPLLPTTSLWIVYQWWVGAGTCASWTVTTWQLQMTRTWLHQMVQQLPKPGCINFQATTTMTTIEGEWTGVGQ